MISVLYLGQLDYSTALQLQTTLVELRKLNRISDVLLLLQHPPVITLGRNSSEKNLLASRELLEQKGVELFESNRGGDVTFHGPGQLVGYPIFDLRAFSPRIGAVEFVRRMEEALIRTCGDLGIPTGRICGLTGVWTQAVGVESCSSEAKAQMLDISQQRKIAAIGIHISQGVTSHGFALNVTTDLDYFKLIVPCGIGDRPVTSVEQELRSECPVPSMEQITHAVSLNFGRVFETQMLWLESLDALLHTALSPDAAEEAGQSSTIGVPLKVPADVQKVRREQQPGGRSVEGKIFLA
jgi:lipoyl(octanoyl) transferase